jgi:hypothetical protein
MAHIIIELGDLANAVSCNIEDFGYYESRVLLGEKEKMTLQKRILRPLFF